MIFYGSKQNGNLGGLFIITESTSLHFVIPPWTLSKMFFYEDCSKWDATKIRKMLQQKNFISKAYVSIDGETGKDIYAYSRLELNEQNFVAHPCFGILFKRIEICCGRNFFLFCNSMLTPTNTIF